MLPAVVHLTGSGLVINDHGSIHATADEVRASRGYCNNDLTNPTRCPGFPLPRICLAVPRGGWATKGDTTRGRRRQGCGTGPLTLY